jgi:hypothetical protein
MIMFMPLSCPREMASDTTQTGGSEEHRSSRIWEKKNIHNTDNA